MAAMTDTRAQPLAPDLSAAQPTPAPIELPDAPLIIDSMRADPQAAVRVIPTDPTRGASGQAAYAVLDYIGALVAHAGEWRDRALAAESAAARPTGPVGELPEDAIEAAARRYCFIQSALSYDALSEADQASWRFVAADVLAAALPFLERATRDTVAAEIAAYPDAPVTSSERFKIGFHEMRAVAARGGEATE